MKERGFRAYTHEVRAILEGRKTETRRIVKPKIVPIIESVIACNGKWVWDTLDYDFRALCPYGRPGDRLWVRETTEADEETSDRVILSRYSSDKSPVLYSGCEDPEFNGSVAHWSYPRDVRPSIHMPRWASRITLEVQEVRVERLHDITEEGAKAEGLSAITKDGTIVKYGIPDRDGLPGTDDLGWPWADWSANPVTAYRTLWEKINGRESWDANPYVWVIKFARMTP